jgi:phenylacetate-CoA ligase
MVRYRSRDITRLERAPCACGRTHVRIMRVAGRDDDMLIIRGVNVFPSQVEAVLVGIPGAAPHYQIVLSREGMLDVMTVEVEMVPGSPDDHVFRRRMAEDIARHIKGRIGLTCEIAVKAPGEVPRSQGKAVRVKDLRRKN